MEPQGRVRQARGDPEEAKVPPRKRRIRGNSMLKFVHCELRQGMTDRFVDFPDFAYLIDNRNFVFAVVS